MSSGPPIDDLPEIFRSVLRLPPEFDLLDAMSFPDVPGWDSLGHMNLVAELERRYSVSLDLEEIVSIGSVRDVRRLIARKKGL